VLRDESEEGRRLGFDGKVGRLASTRFVPRPCPMYRSVLCSKRSTPRKSKSSTAHTLPAKRVSALSRNPALVSRSSYITRKPIATHPSPSPTILSPLRRVSVRPLTTRRRAQGRPGPLLVRAPR
jgi:hypothetical protein